MAALRWKSRLSWLALEFMFLLHLQQNSQLVASSVEVEKNTDRGEVNEGGGVRISGPHGVEPASNDSAIRGDLPLTLQNVAGANLASPIATEVGTYGVGQLSVEGGRARTSRGVKAAFLGLALALATLGGVVMLSGQSPLEKSALKLRKLKALVPIAEVLSNAVGTDESQRLWGAVEALLPELRQTLDAADAQLAGQSILFSRSSSESHQELIARIQDLSKRISEAIAPVHKVARQELETLVKGITPIETSGLTFFEEHLGRAAGLQYAKAFVTYVRSQEAHVDDLIQTATHVVTRSNGRPCFSDYLDGPLLLATVHDFGYIRGVVSARGVAHRQVKDAKESCVKALCSTMSVEITSAKNEYRTLIEGLMAFFEDSEMQTEAHQQMMSDLATASSLLNSDLNPLLAQISPDLPVEKLLGMHENFWMVARKVTALLTLPEQELIPEEVGDRKARVRQSLSSLMKKVVEQVESVKVEASSLAKRSKQQAVEAESRGDFCPHVALTLDCLMEKLEADAQQATNSSEALCRRVSEEAMVKPLYCTMVDAFNEGSKAAKRLREMNAVSGYADLLQVMERGIKGRIKMVTDVNADATTSTKLINDHKEAVKKELENLRQATALPQVAEAAARIEKASHLVAYAVYDGIVSQVERDHQESRRAA
ncbi:hypothetical protein Emed_005666 [Eimeria media]